MFSSVIFEIIFSIILAIIIGKINQSQWFRNCFEKVFNRTVAKDIWEDIIDLSKDNVCCLELKDGRTVTGIVRYVDCDVSGIYIAITYYIVMRDNEELYRYSDDSSVMIIQTSDIITTTIHYSDR